MLRLPKINGHMGRMFIKFPDRIVFGSEMYTGCVLRRAMIQFTPPDRYATIRKKGGARRMHCTTGQHIGKVGEEGSYGRPNRKE